MISFPLLFASECLMQVCFSFHSSLPTSFLFFFNVHLTAVIHFQKTDFDCHFFKRPDLLPPYSIVIRVSLIIENNDLSLDITG